MVEPRPALLILKLRQFGGNLENRPILLTSFPPAPFNTHKRPPHLLKVKHCNTFTFSLETESFRYLGNPSSSTASSPVHVGYE